MTQFRILNIRIIKISKYNPKSRGQVDPVKIGCELKKIEKIKCAKDSKDYLSNSSL